MIEIFFDADTLLTVAHFLIANQIVTILIYNSVVYSLFLGSWHFNNGRFAYKYSVQRPL